MVMSSFAIVNKSLMFFCGWLGFRLRGIPYLHMGLKLQYLLSFLCSYSQAFFLIILVLLGLLTIVGESYCKGHGY